MFNANDILYIHIIKFCTLAYSVNKISKNLLICNSLRSAEMKVQAKGGFTGIDHTRRHEHNFTQLMSFHVQ